MGSIYMRGNRYWIKYRDPKTERLIRHCVGLTRSDALAALRKLDGKMAKIEGKTEAIPFESVWNTYFSNLETRAKGWTVRGASSVSSRLLSFFMGKDARSLTSQDVNAFIQHRQQQGVKAKTINNDLAYLRAALKHAVENGLLGSMPVKIKLLRAPAEAGATDPFL